MPDFSRSAFVGATSPTNLSNASTGRAQRSGASTGAKRLVLGPPQFTALWLGLKTASLLKALKNSNQKTPENTGRTEFLSWRFVNQTHSFCKRICGERKGLNYPSKRPVFKGLKQRSPPNSKHGRSIPPPLPVSRAMSGEYGKSCKT
jgi:hypothetical protein